MSLFAIGDTHLSLGTDKPMNIFRGWDNYVERLVSNWNRVVDQSDTVVIMGDVSWGMSLSEAYKDFELLNSLPGKKIIMKGNHDYWWNTKKKMDEFFSKTNLKLCLFCITMHTGSVTSVFAEREVGFLTRRAISTKKL